jgi:hypothetical protein
VFQPFIFPQMKFFSRNKSVLFGQVTLLENQLQQEKERVQIYKEKWKQARLHLRQANKGAEKNSIALKLTMFQLRKLQEIVLKLIHEKNSKETTKEECEIQNFVQ